jgi:hypothetical protein
MPNKRQRQVYPFVGIGVGEIDVGRAAEMAGAAGDVERSHGGLSAEKGIRSMFDEHPRILRIGDAKLQGGPSAGLQLR